MFYYKTTIKYFKDCDAMNEWLAVNVGWEPFSVTTSVDITGVDITGSTYRVFMRRKVLVQE